MKETKAQKAARQQRGRQIGRVQRYVLVGGALGLYYGLFYRSTDAAPDYGIAIVLAVLAAVVTVIVRFWKKKQPLAAIAKSFFWTFLFYAVLLLALAVRTLAEQIGGRVGLTIATTLIGMGLAFGLATRTQNS